MKLIGYLVSILILILIIIPAIIIRSCSPSPVPEEILEWPKGDKVNISVYNHQSKKTMELDLEEYIVGVVAAEMPATFELEALKAQAIAARTYTVRRMKAFGASPSDIHPKEDVCTDYGHCQAWISKEDRFTAWEKDKNLKDVSHVSLWNKLIEAVGTTKSQIITYDNKPIDPLFHSTSGGKTENSEDYFSSKLPYLRSVESKYEEKSPHLETKADLSIDEFISKIKENHSGIKIDKKNIKKEIKIKDKTEGGKVANIKVGDKNLTGKEVREALGLRSSNFTIKIEKDQISFKVIGYGHGVGLSQYGADGMAKKGKGYKEILKHYYTGVEIVGLSKE